MAEPTQFTFSLSEVTTALIKQQELHEGQWVIAFEFGLAAGMMGPSPTEAKPSALLQINSVQLVRPPTSAEAANLLVIDASKVNPRTILTKRLRNNPDK